MAIDSVPTIAVPVSTRTTSLASVVVFATTVFSSAFLLFLVQPLLGKYILPWFGGSPSVWTTCMLLFQALLFFGYAYTHALSRLPTRWQALIHASLLLTALCTLPITPAATWKPTEIGNPSGQIILLLLACVGMPYFLLSATGPLLQSWFARTQPASSPYRLYALSNAGSLLALVAYPFLFEPSLSKPHQTVAWSAAFALFALMCLACAAIVALAPARTLERTETSDGAAEHVPVTLDTVVLWFALAMLASMALLATTNQVCLDVAVIPFLWVVPLALYLLTFILCFDGERWYHRGLFMTVALLTLPVAFFYTLIPASGSLLFQLGIYFTALFSVCMVCHGELVRLKPASQHLTLFYMTISAGGSCGGLFVGLLAPAIFVDYYEFHLSALGFLLLSSVVILRGRGVSSPRFRQLVGLAVTVWTIGVIGVSMNGTSTRFLAMTRNFYGNLKVEREVTQGSTRSPRLLVHGRIVHGAQDVASPSRRQEPTSYYGPTSGIALAMNHVNRNPNRNVGVIGLGIGTLAAYSRDGDRIRFYEINPAVIEFARTYFTFLGKCAGDDECVLGDARLVMEREAPQSFDLLALDAFSGDAIPVHLLTREAFDVYLKHLAPGGLLVCHVSNVHFDLLPVLAAVVDDAGLSAIQVDSSGDTTKFLTDSTWVILARDKQDLPAIETAKTLDHLRKIHWTDDRNNLFEVLTR